MSRAYHAIAHHRGLTLGLIAGLFAAIAVVGIFHKVGYNCPVGPKKKEVVRQQGSNPSQQPGPSNGGLNGSTNPSVPSTPEQPPKGNDDPQPSPPDPSPPNPSPPVSAPPTPLIDLSPVVTPVCHLTAALIRICN